MDAPLDPAANVYPLDIIFSCTICQETIADVYANGSPDLNYKAALLEYPCKLWITECGHVTCSHHFEGGGVPFYRDESQPEAPCPLCLQEKGDARPKKLYGIYGPEPNKHDPEVPVAYFDIPPALFKEEKCSPTISALRFQYIALVRYGLMMRSRYLKPQSHTAAILAERLEAAELEKTALRARIEELASFKDKYLRWKKREPEIKHYLESFSSLARENTLLKNNLVRLGYEVPRTNWSLQQPNIGSRPDPPRDAAHDGQRYIATQNGHSTHARGSNVVFDDQQSVSGNSHGPCSRPNFISAATLPPASRKRSVDVMMDYKQDDSLLSKRRKSQQLMPPPPIPIHRTASSSHYEPKDKDPERLYSSKYRCTPQPTTVREKAMQGGRLNPSGDTYRPLSEFERESSRWESSSHSVQSQTDNSRGHNRHVLHNDAHQNCDNRRIGITSKNRTPSGAFYRPLRQLTLQYDRLQRMASDGQEFQYQPRRMANEQPQAQSYQSRRVSDYFFLPPTDRKRETNHFHSIDAPVRHSEQISDLEVYKMVPPPSRGRRNSTLNSLSFIDEPYTTLNEPIYSTVNQSPAIVAPPKLSTISLADRSHSSRSSQPRRLFSLSGSVHQSRDEHNSVKRWFHTDLEPSGSHRRYDPAYVGGDTHRSSLSTATPPSGPLWNGVKSSRGVFTSAGVGGARRKLVR